MSEDRGQKAEGFGFGGRTRRRPIRRDYAAAKDAEGGKIGIWNVEVGGKTD